MKLLMICQILFLPDVLSAIPCRFTLMPLVLLSGIPFVGVPCIVFGAILGNGLSILFPLTQKIPQRVHGQPHGSMLTTIYLIVATFLPTF